MSLGFTALGSIMAVISTRQSRLLRRAAKTVDYGSAHRLLLGRTRHPTGSAGVLNVISQFIFVSSTGRTVFGTLDKMESSVFLDLLSACTVPEFCDVVARFIANAIVESDASEKPTQIVVAKEGNVLLAREVARQLNFGLVVVRTKIPAIRFGYPLEGLLPHGAYVIAVDDVAADGEMLVRLARRTRRYGGRIERAFCAVERLDGNAAQQLRACDVNLFAPIKLDEATLRELRKLPAADRDHDTGDRQANFREGG